MFSAQLNFQFGSWYCFLKSMGNIIMQNQPYPLSLTFNVFRQMTIFPKVSQEVNLRLYVYVWDPREAFEVKDYH